jgi:hypothetical protein
MGHTTPDVTAKHYIRTADPAERAVVEAVSRVVFGA